MQGLITPFTMTVAAQNSVTGAEVKLTRQVQVVAIPVFQFGIYSDSDLVVLQRPFVWFWRTHAHEWQSVARSEPRSHFSWAIRLPSWAR